MESFDDVIESLSSREDSDLIKAISKYQINDVQNILLHHPSQIKIRNSRNRNLPLHDIVDDKFFNVRNLLIENSNNENINELALLVKNVAKIMKILIENGVRYNVGGVHNAGGLYELNYEKIDFVTYRSRTPFDILLTKFESILEYCISKRNDNNGMNNGEVSTDVDMDRSMGAGTNMGMGMRMDMDIEDANEGELIHDNTIGSGESDPQTPLYTVQDILKHAIDCIQYCIQVSKQAWEARGCDDGYTIMNSAISVFPLLKVETLKFLFENFHQQSSSSIPRSRPSALECRDLMGRTVLIKAIYEATKRTQWGDWKERFQMILEEKYNGVKQCWIRDEKGRLPLHLALERGLKWENGLKKIVEVDSSLLLEVDPLTGLFPYAMTGFGDSGTLDTSFDLLMMNPLVVERHNFSGSENRKRRRNVESSSKNYFVVRRSRRLQGKNV